MPTEDPVSSLISLQSSVSVSAGKLVSLSHRHLSTAARFSRAVGKLEQEYGAVGDSWEDIFSFSTGCVLTAAASLEAYANELFFERDTVFPGYTSDLLNKLWETYERKTPQKKFDFALLLRKSPTLDWGKPPCQDVKALIDLRDALMHYKPEWDNEADRHQKISDLLRYKFDPSPFPNDDPLIFPLRWASHSCTKWAVKSAVEFTNEFAKVGGLPEKFLRRLTNAE